MSGSKAVIRLIDQVSSINICEDNRLRIRNLDICYVTCPGEESLGMTDLDGDLRTSQVTINFTQMTLCNNYPSSGIDDDLSSDH